MARIIKKRNEEGNIPDFIKKYVDTKPKNFPTIRSIMMAKPGWCIVEADYQTAEMRGLGYISGDEKLLEVLEGEDHNFGLPKPECIPEGIDEEDCKVRLSYPDFIEFPEDKDKYLMTYTANGEIKARFTMDQLQRHPDGTLKGPRHDMHWEVLEFSRRKCREVQDKKKDRGAGKVVNFCVDESTMVLTDSGYKSIKDVSIDDLLWDGYNWVNHGGVVYRGEKLVIEYDGIIGTPDHVVFTEEGKLTLLDARIRQAKIIETEREGKVITVSSIRSNYGYNLCNRRREIQTLCTCRLQKLRNRGHKKSRKHVRRKKPNLLKLQHKIKVQGYSSGYSGQTWKKIWLHGSALYKRNAQAIKRLFRKRNKSNVQFQRRLCSLGIQSIPWRNIYRYGVRQDRQQQTLLERQSSISDVIYKPHKQELYTKNQSRQIHRGSSRRRLFSRYNKKSISIWIIGKRNSREVQNFSPKIETQTEILKSAIQRNVYDIINAGPENRFTANGRLISNSSSYGGQAPSLSRKIEADTGYKVSVEEVEKMLEAIEARQPVATIFFAEMEKVPETTGFLRANSGRIMHCHVLPGSIKGIGARTREGQITSLGRKCRNFFLQENVAASAARACKNLVDLGMRKDLKGYIAVCLYDSCVIHCPVEERHIWAKALDLYMTQANGWLYHGRVLRYPIDLEYNAGWSTHADPEFHAQLKDASWNPTPDNLISLERWLDDALAFYKNNPMASVQKYY